MTEQNELTPANVVVAWLHGIDVNSMFMTSMVDLLVYDMAHQRHIVNGGGRIARYSGVNVSGPRNSVVKEFLQHPTADWLWMLDTDMTFDPDTLERLMAVADPVTAPIVGGLCFGATDGELWPTMYELVGDAERPQFARWENFPVDTLVKVTATGAACLLIHRDALKAIGERFDSAYPWFQESSIGGEPASEDLTFCLRAGACEVPIHVHTGVHLGHAKPTLLTYEKYVGQLRSRDLAGTKSESGGDLVSLRSTPLVPGSVRAVETVGEIEEVDPTAPQDPDEVEDEEDEQRKGGPLSTANAGALIPPRPWAKHG